MAKIEYSTPSPPDTCSNWSGSFSDCGGSVTSSSSTWNGHDLNGPLTPSTSFTTTSSSHTNISVTSAPQTVSPSPTLSPVSSTSPNDTTGVRGRRYVKLDEEWIRHRETIKALYKVKTLKDVKAIMDRDYNFVATERMYKSRLHKWGVYKNMTAPQVKSIIHRVRCAEQQKLHHNGVQEGGCKAAVMDVGEHVDAEEITKAQRYMNRKPDGLKDMRADPENPLDYIKKLSVDPGKGRSRRVKMSIPAAKLERQQTLSQLHTLSSPPSDMSLSWSPETRLGGGQAETMAQFFEIGVDHQGFPSPYPYACSPLPMSPASSSHWQHLSHSTSQLLEPGSASPAGHGLPQEQLMAPLENLHMHQAVPDMSFQQEMHVPVSSPSWEHTPVHLHGSAMPSIWHVADTGLEGSVGLYDASF